MVSDITFYGSDGVAEVLELFPPLYVCTDLISCLSDRYMGKRVSHIYDVTIYLSLMTAVVCLIAHNVNATAYLYVIDVYVISVSAIRMTTDHAYTVRKIKKLHQVTLKKSYWLFNCRLWNGATWEVNILWDGRGHLLGGRGC